MSLSSTLTDNNVCADDTKAEIESALDAVTELKKKTLDEIVPAIDSVLLILAEAAHECDALGHNISGAESDLDDAEDGEKTEIRAELKKDEDFWSDLREDEEFIDACAEDGVFVSEMKERVDEADNAMGKHDPLDIHSVSLGELLAEMVRRFAILEAKLNGGAAAAAEASAE